MRSFSEKSEFFLICLCAPSPPPFFTSDFCPRGGGGLSMKQTLVTNHQAIIQQLDDAKVIGITNQCLCLPKAELSTKNSTKRELCCCFVEFWRSTRFTRKKVSQPTERNVQNLFLPFWLRSSWTASNLSTLKTLFILRSKNLNIFTDLAKSQKVRTSSTAKTSHLRKQENTFFS